MDLADAYRMVAADIQRWPVIEVAMPPAQVVEHSHMTVVTVPTKVLADHFMRLSYAARR